jgi:ABC-type multidrug transport system ATPase subunit
VIAVRRLTKRFDAVQALGNVTLDVARGECVVLTGPPRAGRSTLLHVLAGLVPPSAGSAEIDGLDVVGSRERVRARVAFADGWLAAAGGLRVDEYLRFAGASASRSRGLKTAGYKDSMSATDSRTIAGRAQLDGAARVDRLSRSGRARLALASALARPAEVLLLDEPLRYLDAAARACFTEWLKERRDLGTTVLAACGDEGGTPLAGDRILVMDAGRLTPALRIVAGAG